MDTKSEFGIDIGTSFSSVANINIKEDIAEVEILNLIGSKGLIPSLVLLDNDDNIIAHGQEAFDKYESKIGKTLIREFKSALLSGKGFKSTSIEPLQVYKSFLSYIRKEIESKYDFSTLDGSRICITYPAVDNKSLLPNTISRIAEEIFMNCDITLMDEASANTQYVDSMTGFLTTLPQIILVIDSGGGTTDFAVAKAEYPFLSIFSAEHKPLEIEFISYEHCGGRDIDIAIYNKIKKNLGTSTDPARYKEYVLSIIRKAKEEYDWNSKKDLEIPELAIKIKSKDLIKCITPTIQRIFNKAKLIMEEANQKEKPIEEVILAGGNTNITFLVEELESLFSPMPISSIPPKNLQTSVAEGATLFLHQRNDRIRYRLDYDVSAKYRFKGREHSIKLFKRNQKHPNAKNPTRSILTQASSATEINLEIIFIDNQNNRMPKPIKISFDPPLNKSNEIIRVDFEIDFNGFIRYTAEPLRTKYRQQRDVLKEPLFDKSTPNW